MCVGFTIAKSSGLFWTKRGISKRYSTGAGWPALQLNRQPVIGRASNIKYKAKWPKCANVFMLLDIVAGSFGAG